MRDARSSRELLLLHFRGAFALRTRHRRTGQELDYQQLLRLPNCATLGERRSRVFMGLPKFCLLLAALLGFTNLRVAISADELVFRIGASVGKDGKCNAYSSKHGVHIRSSCRFQIALDCYGVTQ